MEEKLDISNYCACFIDLLGQRNALAGQSLLPESATEKKEREFLEIVKNSVGAIERLQVQAQNFRQGKESCVSQREKLDAKDQMLYEEMQKAVAKQQRWSDGLVYYSSLATTTIKCPMNAVMEIFMLAGSLCFLGIASKQPIRGAIETAWGVELHENELYGAVVANSYELESKVAQYPRIVIGEKTIEYLNAHLSVPPDAEDKLGLYNRNCAQLCLNMTAVDQDGHHIVDYLGEAFTNSVTGSESNTLFNQAYNFICDQYNQHKESRNTKLALRYTWLRGYFEQQKHRHA